MVSSFDRNNIGLSNISAENNDRVNIKAVKVNLHFFFLYAEPTYGLETHNIRPKTIELPRFRQSSRMILFNPF